MLNIRSLIQRRDASARPRHEPVLRTAERKAPRFSANDLPAINAKAKIAADQAIFKPYAVPPGVAGEKSVELAMDESSSPALGQWLNDAVSEGVAFLGYARLAEMSQRPEYRHMVEVRATECTREWIEFKGFGDEDKGDRIAELEAEFERLNVRGAFKRMLEMDGYFGIGQLYPDIGLARDDKMQRNPLLLTPKTFKPGSLRALVPVEPFWTSPQKYNSADPLNSTFYKPEIWWVQGATLHATRIMTFVSRPVPDVLKPTYNFGGLALTQMAKPYVDNWLRTRQSVADLINAFSIVVFSCDMTGLMDQPLPGSETPGGTANLIDRIEAFNAFRNNRGTFMRDKDSEDLQILSAQLGTLDKLQAQAQEQMCSVSSTPLVKFTGITPSGLNASSEGEIRVWYDFCASIQESMLRDPLTRVMHMAMLNVWGEIDDGIRFDFKPLWQMDATQVVANEKVKADIRKQDVEANIISAEEARESVANDPDSLYAGIDLSSELPAPEVDLSADPLEDPAEQAA